MVRVRQQPNSSAHVPKLRKVTYHLDIERCRRSLQQCGIKLSGFVNEPYLITDIGLPPLL